MCAVFMAGWILNRPSHMINSVALAAFLILLIAPYQLFDAGFQLSFVVVLAIVALTPRISRRLEPWIETDPFVPIESVPGWKRRVSGAARRLAELFAVSLAAWLG